MWTGVHRAQPERVAALRSANRSHAAAARGSARVRWHLASSGAWRRRVDRHLGEMDNWAGREDDGKVAGNRLEIRE
jgi:hypothetical protein